MSYATYNDWLRFVQEGMEPTIRNLILNSWKRCRDMTLDPFGQPDVCDDPKETVVSDSKGLYSRLEKFIVQSMKMMQTANTAWMLCGPNGNIIKCGPQSQLIEDMMTQWRITPGTGLAESCSGTNAVALSIVNSKPSFCNGSEHFLKGLHSFSSASAPFYDIDGSLKGFIVLLGLFPEIDGKQLLGMISLFIQLVDRDLRLNRSKEACNYLKKLVAQLCTNNSDPMIMVSKKGFVRQINPAAIQLFKLEKRSLKEEQLDNLIGFTPTISELAVSAIPCNGRKMSIKLPGKTLNVTYDRVPLYSETDQFLGVVLSFHEKSASANTKNNSIPEARYYFRDIIGNTPAVTMAKRLAEHAAKTSINVLLIGDSGTGKEMFAQSIHNASDRKDQPFISINCAAIPKEIAESELFGYSPGAFTGAIKGGNTGKLEDADNGTVFLDEIGDMPYELQSKLLRVLEERTITRIGSSKEIPIDVRIIAATNKNIPQLCAENRFRQDLYYRLSVSTIHLPSLSSSHSDIPILVSNFIEYFNETMGKKIKGVKPEIMEQFETYSWPGNIRELRNAIEFAVMLNTGEELITWKELPGQLRMELLYTTAATEEKTKDPLFQERQEIEDSEKKLFQKAIRMTNGNMTEAAKVLNVGRATLYRKMKLFGISRSK